MFGSAQKPPQRTHHPARQYNDVGKHCAYDGYRHIRMLSGEPSQKDGEPIFSGLMHAGDKRQVSARDEISLNVGDAGAFTYKLNGKEGRPFGAPGEVVSKRIRVADLKDYVTP